MAKTKGGLPVPAAKNLPTNWEQEMAEDASKAVQAEANTGGSAYLSIRAGVLSFQGNPLPDNSFDGAVLGAAFENAYYEGDWDPDSPSSPVCFAVGQEEAALAPHPDSPKPQSAQCKGCPKNAFGTADKGKGKACKNSRRLALLHSDYLRSPAAVAESPVVMLKVPPTSLTAWAQFVKKCGNVLNKPPYAVVCRVKASPDPKVQVRVSFDFADAVKEKPLLAALFARHRDPAVAEGLLRPFQAREEQAPKSRKPAKPGGRGKY